MSDPKLPHESKPDDFEEIEGTAPGFEDEHETASGEGLTLSGMMGGLPSDVDKLDEQSPEERFREKGAP